MPTGDLSGTGRALHVSNEAIYLSITLFVLGFGVGPLVFAPLSEMIGRRPVYCISIFFYFIFTLPSCLAKNIATMLAGRMIAGIASSAPMTNVGGSIADVWAVENRGFPMAIFSMTLFMGPCLGPLFGGWISFKTGQWRWIYWVLFILCGVVSAFTFVMPETYPPILLRKKAERLNKEHNTDVYISKHDTNRLSLKESLKISMSRPFILMFCEPIILFMSFYLSFIYSLLYALFFAFPIAFEEIRGWNMGMTGVSFVSIIVSSSVTLERG
jgi:multidrug resistance protein